MAETKLTPAQRKYLELLYDSPGPIEAYSRPVTAMWNKLAKRGLVDLRYGYPNGYSITEAGISALQEP